MRLFSSYVINLQKRLTDADIRAELLLVQSNGGMSSPEEAKSKPVNFLYSGPAGGVEEHWLQEVSLLGFLPIGRLDALGPQPWAADTMTDVTPDSAGGGVKSRLGAFLTRRYLVITLEE